MTDGVGTEGVGTDGGAATVRRIGLLLGPALAALVLALPLGGLEPAAQRTLAVTLLMATFWLTEAIPIPATALLPVLLFPLLGVSASRDVVGLYVNDAIFLFLGGFMLALAIERCGLHRRLAHAVLSAFGRSPESLSLSFMGVAAFASAWISNTATALVLLPMALAVIANVETQVKVEDERQAGALKRFSALVLLSIAYGANIGGLMTPIGTAPNVIFLGQVAVLHPDQPELQLTFLSWMLAMGPLVVVFVPVSWLLLSRVALPCAEVAPAVLSARRTRPQLGPMSRDEKVVATVFTVTALAWIFRAEIDLGFVRVPGWADLLGLSHLLHDSTVAIGAATLLFVLPSQERGRRLLDWSIEPRVPWGVLLLLGGGFALAGTFESSGLSEWFGATFAHYLPESQALSVGATALMVTFMTEVMSNTAIASVLLPILGSISVAAGMHPFTLMLPATISASCAFMLPVATPPNAIVFGSGRITIAQMARAGLLLNLAGAVLVTMFLLTWWTWLLNLAT